METVNPSGPYQAIIEIRRQAKGDPELLRLAEDLARRSGIDINAVSLALDEFVTQDKDMLLLKEHVMLLSQVDDCVLIQGETGTGKELIAHALHGNRKGRFVAINCAGMPETLIESELFGYAKGAFTDAKVDNSGLVQYAENGTLFLDEVGDLPLALQSKLLRAIQQRTIRRVGAKNEEAFNCRIIAATHFNLTEQVKLKQFRQDLFARLSTFVLYLTPLRSRLDDIPLLISRYNTNSKKLPILTVDKWGGCDLSLNVRSVLSIIRRWEVLSDLPKELKPVA